MNQSRAHPAATSRVPGSANRWLAPAPPPGYSRSALGLGSAVEVQHHLIAPPTISVGAVTAASRGAGQVVLNGGLLSAQSRAPTM